MFLAKIGHFPSNFLRIEPELLNYLPYAELGQPVKMQPVKVVFFAYFLKEMNQTAYLLTVGACFVLDVGAYLKFCFGHRAKVKMLINCFYSSRR